MEALIVIGIFFVFFLLDKFWPVILIIAIIALLAYIYSKKQREEEKRTAEYHKREAERLQELRREQTSKARTDNARLEAEVTNCLKEQARIQKELQHEEKLKCIVSAHIVLFSDFDASILDAISDNQNNQYTAKKREYDAKVKMEKDLRSRIASNLSIINAMQ